MTTDRFWTEERTKMLTDLCSDATLSSADIAQRVGCSRNAVLGKIHRLGLSVKAKQVDPERVMRAKAARQARKNEAQRARHVPCSKSTEAKGPPQEAPRFIGSLHLPFGDLRMFSGVDANQCRFIEGDGPDYLCCGTETLPGESWCGHHAEIVRGKATNVSVRGSAIHSAVARKNGRRFGFGGVGRSPELVGAL